MAHGRGDQALQRMSEPEKKPDEPIDADYKEVGWELNDENVIYLSNVGSTNASWKNSVIQDTVRDKILNQFLSTYCFRND